MAAVDATPLTPAPDRASVVDAVVFSVAMRSGDVEVIGIPFEHRGRSRRAKKFCHSRILVDQGFRPAS
ncbi:hypothetical protein [Burkholderia ubonensis]|uniref:Transposase n=1 Tax=Burkholderia ubonensis TaxID=101571 RepID=A0ABD4E5I5_9BURK|nr:hypothetical protein [Burkholderia ubonensis]KVN88819.1 hypothetical protein WJ68_04575 [Burkholderia ubonensis]